MNTKAFELGIKTAGTIRDVIETTKLDPAVDAVTSFWAGLKYGLANPKQITTSECIEGTWIPVGE